jgi:hypothetical protein
MNASRDHSMGPNATRGMSTLRVRQLGFRIHVARVASPSKAALLCVEFPGYRSREFLDISGEFRLQINATFVRENDDGP